MLSLALLSLAPAHVLALLVLTWTLVLITLALRGLTGRALPGRLVFLGLLASTGAFRLPVVRRILRRGEAYPANKAVVNRSAFLIGCSPLNPRSSVSKSEEHHRSSGAPSVSE